ncbi:MAG TPA: MFS transporter, partial [Stellaceae bacterium]|nr:MFS transporter [Stellaceae bacterium]
PPRLFLDPVIRIASVTSFIMSFVMFGAIVLLPVFLQRVGGLNAANSGVMLIPFMAGVVAGSFGGGNLTRRTGRYKPFPLVGAVLASVGFVLLARLDGSAMRPWAAIDMGILGVGIGFTLPTLLVAVQNAADRRDIGIATASVAFFRSLGGSFGAAALWAILSLALGVELDRAGPTLLASGFHIAFLAGAVGAAFAFGTALFLKEVPLRVTNHPAPGRR